MKKSTKRTAFLLVLLIAGSTLISCGSETDETSTNTPGGTVNEQTETPPETEETRAHHGLDVDALDFGGEELNSYALDWQGYKYYFFADESTGNNMNDAIYNRTLFVQDALGIKMVTQKNGDLLAFVNDIKASISADDDQYDLLFNHCIQDIASFVVDGYIFNLNNMPNIDMTAEWWNTEQMDKLRLGQNTYYAVNDMMIPCPAVILFNKGMIANNNLANPYDLVYEGKWTLDSMANIARAVTQDINGDGVMDLNDQYGIAATSRGSSCYINFMTGSDQFITDRDADGKIQLAFKTEKTQSIIDKFAALANENVIYNPPSGEKDVQLYMDTNRLMFQILYLTYVEDFRDSDVEFGILPYPKYDEQQENYINLDWGGLLSVPTTIENPEMVGAAMELLAWQSANDVIPAYYDQVLAGKLARDEDSANMLDIIFDTIAYEIGGNYFGFSAGFNDLFYLLPRLAVNDKSTDFISLYEKHNQAAESELATFYEKLAKIENN